MWDYITYFWPLLLAAVERFFALWATLHAVLQKRETRTMLGWIGLIWLTPLLGSLFYYCFGINRIERKGHTIHERISKRSHQSHYLDAQPLPDFDETYAENYQQLIAALRSITRRPLLDGNKVTPLFGGDAAFPEMLKSLREAKKSIAVCSYIFDNDRAGIQFIDELEAAQLRGVEVRILIDAVGARYSKPSAVQVMLQRNLKVARFLPTYLGRIPNYANLRNHRKIMTIDGEIGFTGGMNIREGNRVSLNSKHPVEDVHFRLDGPIVSHLQVAFAADWSFTTKEELDGDAWKCSTTHHGKVWARGIEDGPDASFDHIRLAMLSAINEARHSIDIATPYFLPDDALSTALSLAAMKGIRVRILIPSINNIALVGWATTAFLPELLERHCEVYSSAPPFDHTKVMLVDGLWTLLGSSNWDPRSFRLNFEFNVECYSTELNEQLTSDFEAKIVKGKRITLEEINSRNLLIRIRDGIARLASPYL